MRVRVLHLSNSMTMNVRADLARESTAILWYLRTGHDTLASGSAIQAYARAKVSLSNLTVQRMRVTGLTIMPTDKVEKSISVVWFTKETSKTTKEKASALVRGQTVQNIRASTRTV